MAEGRGDRPDSAGSAPRGLILAGGQSRRMGEDKGLIAYHGQPQVVWLSQLLLEFCASVHVSIGPQQRDSSCYESLQTVIDHEPGRGPAGGLMSAWELVPSAAWLLVAVDLPLLDRVTLGVLTEGRSRQHLATAFRHPDGPLEPLCTIWEPAARPVLERRLGRGDASLRRLLEAGPVYELEPPAPRAIRSVDSPRDRNRVQRRLQEQRE